MRKTRVFISCVCYLLILISTIGCFGKTPTAEELSNFSGWKATLDRNWIRDQFNLGRLWSANNQFDNFWHDTVCFTPSDWDAVFTAWWDAVAFDYSAETLDGAAYRIKENRDAELMTELRYLELSSIYAAGLERWLGLLGEDASTSLQNLGYNRGNGAHQLFIDCVIASIKEKKDSNQLDHQTCQITLNAEADYTLADTQAIQNLLTDSFVAWQALDLARVKSDLQTIYLNSIAQLERRNIKLDPHLATILEAVEGISYKDEYSVIN